MLIRKLTAVATTRIPEGSGVSATLAQRGPTGVSKAMRLLACVLLMAVSTGCVVGDEDDSEETAQQQMDEMDGLSEETPYSCSAWWYHGARLLVQCSPDGCQVCDYGTGLCCGF